MFAEGRNIVAYSFSELLNAVGAIECGIVQLQKLMDDEARFDARRRFGTFMVARTGAMNAMSSSVNPLTFSNN